jgi:hypothetical protein
MARGFIYCLKRLHDRLTTHEQICRAATSRLEAAVETLGGGGDGFFFFFLCFHFFVYFFYFYAHLSAVVFFSFCITTYR